VWPPPPGRRGVQQGHGASGAVAALADLRFVVGSGQDGSGRAWQRGRIREDAHHVGAALALFAQPFPAGP
jgi:hypothetical protein